MSRRPCTAVLAATVVAVQPTPTSASVAVQERDKLLVGATVIDGTGAESIPDAWIRVSGDRIEAR